MVVFSLTTNLLDMSMDLVSKKHNNKIRFLLVGVIKGLQDIINKMINNDQVMI